MNRSELEEALFSGARLAVKRAFRWSAGELWPGDTGAENLIQVSIADAIHRTATVKPAIHLEPTLARIDEEQFPGDARRVDLALMWAGSTDTDRKYFSVIEVKKHPGGYVNDLAKIFLLVDRVDSIRHGYLVTYFQKNEGLLEGARPLETRVDRTSRRIAEEVDRLHRRDCVNIGTRPLGKFEAVDGTWRAAVLVTRFDKV